MTDNLPKDWVRVRLDEIAEVRLGRQRSPKNHNGTQMRPYIRAANVGWDGLKLDDVKEMNFTDEEAEVYRLQAGDIVLSEASGSPSEVGKPAIWNNEIKGCCLQNTLIRVRSHGADPKFLMYYLKNEAIRGAFIETSRGVGIHHLGIARLAEWPVPLPPLAEQNRIVAIIEGGASKIKAGISSLALAERKAVMLRRVILDIFTGQGLHGRIPQSWSTLALRDLGVVTTGKTPSPKNSRFYGGGIPFVTPADLGFGDPAVTFGRDLTTLGLAESRRLQSGAVLTVCIGATLGKVGWVDRVVATNQQINAIQPHVGLVDTKFLAYSIASPTIQKSLWRESSSTTLPILNKGKFEQIKLTLPPWEEQQVIVRKIDEALDILGFLCSAVHSANRRAEHLSQSLLRSAFAGNLVSQHPDDESASHLLKRIGAEGDSARKIWCGHKPKMSAASRDRRMVNPGPPTAAPVLNGTQGELEFGL